MKIFSAQLKGTTTVVSGSSASITGSFTGSIAGIDINATNTFTASTIARLSSIETISSSNDSRVNSLEAFSSSIFTTNTFTSSTSARLNSIETISASNISRLTSLETTSASVDTLNITQNTRLTSLEIKTGSLATTGSNFFSGSQTITGSLYISADLIVQGSSSLQNITASAVSIGTNIINLNTANPAIRYAGLSIGDSGSIGSSGSFLYDSVQDEMIFVHRGANTTVTSSVVLMGPQTFDNIGSETYPTSNYIQKGTGNEHLVDSCIIDNGTTVCVNTTLKANGQVCGVMGNFSCFGIGTMTPVGKLDVTLVNTRRFIVTYDDSIITIKGASDTGAGENLRVIGDNLIFNTNSVGSGTERMRITSAGNVGIGTCTPAGILQVSSENSGNTQMLLVRNYATSATGNFTGCYTAEIRGTSNGCVRHAMLINNEENDSTRRVLDITSTFGTIASFVSNGNVGIGTATPTRPLEIRTGGSNTTPSAIFNGAAVQAIVAGEPQLVFSSNISPTAGTPTGTELARAGIGFQYVSAAQPSEFSIGIQCTNVCNSSFKFWNGTERMRITNGGNLLIGITSNFAYQGGAVLRVNCEQNTGTNIHINNQANNASAAAHVIFGTYGNGWSIGMGSSTSSSGNSFYFSSDPSAALNKVATLSTGGTWSTSGGGTSDKRTKENIEYIEDNGINYINLLKPAKFKFKLNPNNVRRGFIAQDVLEVIPDLVLGDGDKEGGIYGLDYDGVLALTVKAIQEQQCTINTLKSCLGIN
jgi:hypothetical protein